MEKTSFEKLAEDVSSKFADLIEAGKAPWSMGGSIPEYPVDAISGKPLAGITALQLLMKEKSAGFSDNRWLTEPQIAALGGKISKGARGIPSVVWTETTAGKQTQTKIPTTYYNVEQCENLSRLPPLSPYNHNPRDLMSDICAGFGLKTTHEYGNPSAYVNINNVLILGDSSVYDPSRKNYDKERLNKALDGIWAVTKFVNNRKHKSFSNQPEGGKELALREKLARTFMQSYAGNRFPILDKDAEQAENKNLADFIRKHPASLFTSAADASRLVDRIMEISERSYILFDYERQDAFILKAGECRSYLAKEFSKLSLSGTLLNDSEVRTLKDTLFQQGHFSPYSSNINILNPAVQKNLCSQLNHCGFNFIENQNRENLLSPDVADRLLAARSRSAMMAERAEKAILESAIPPDPNTRDWLETKINDHRISRDESLFVAAANKTWNEIAYQRRTADKDFFSLKHCWVVDFDADTVRKATLKDAVGKAADMADTWMEKDHNYGSSVRSPLREACRELFNAQKDSSEYDDLFGRVKAEKELAFCDRILNPARDSDGRGNIVLRDLNHKGLVICSDPRTLPEVCSWGPETLKAQCTEVLKKEGLSFEAIEALGKNEPDYKKQEHFNDFCNAQKTFYSIESKRRETEELNLMRKTFSDPSPEKVEAIKAAAREQIRAMRLSPKLDQQRGMTQQSSTSDRAANRTQQAPER